MCADVASNRKMLKLLLEKKGASVEMAEDGREAVGILQSRKDEIQTVFMDNLMPHMVSSECFVLL